MSQKYWDEQKVKVNKDTIYLNHILKYVREGKFPKLNNEMLKLENEINTLRLKASQEAQNAYLISQLKAPCPIPAYTVPNPNCCYNNCGCTTL